MPPKGKLQTLHFFCERTPSNVVLFCYAVILLYFSFHVNFLLTIITKSHSFLLVFLGAAICMLRILSTGLR